MQLTIPGLTQRERHLSEIRNLYWHLRAIRPHQQARRRQLYRLIEKQKAVLITDGLDPELLRLWCRQWSRCHPEAARARFEQYLLENNTDLKKTLKA